MKNLVIKPVKTSELRVGRLYVDSLRDNRCVLEFVKYDKVGDPYFGHIDGYNPYGFCSNGLLGFADSGEDWYEIVSFEE